jgi:hypothetical protein
MKTPLNPLPWIIRFRRNRRDRPEPAWQAPLEVPPAALPMLIRSIREFQLGDGGGPAALIAWNAGKFRDQSPAMRELVDLWFTEEKEHSRLLGRLLERLGGEPIRSHWSFRLFCGVRKLAGVTFELQVLTLTELVSTAYYRELRRLGPDAALRDVCSLILRDEAGHVAFHNDRLAAAGRSPLGPGGAAWSLQFWLCGIAAATVLWSSHGRCLRALGGSRKAFFDEARRQISRFLTRLALKRVADAPEVERGPVFSRASLDKSP